MKFHMQKSYVSTKSCNVSLTKIRVRIEIILEYILIFLLDEPPSDNEEEDLEDSGHASKKQRLNLDEEEEELSMTLKPIRGASKTLIPQARHIPSSPAPSIEETEIPQVQDDDELDNIYGDDTNGDEDNQLPERNKDPWADNGVYFYLNIIAFYLNPTIYRWRLKI